VCASTSASAASTALVDAGARRQLATRTSLSQRVKQRLYKMVRQEAWDEVVERAVDMTQAQFAAAYNNNIPDQATTTSCKATEAQLTRLSDHVDYFVQQPMDWIDEKGYEALEKAGEATSLQRKLTALNTAAAGVGAALGAMSALPRVGPAFKALRKLVKGVDSSLIKPGKINLARFNGRITTPAKKKIQVLLIKNEIAAEALEVARHMYGEYFQDPMRFTDMVCPTVTLCTVCQPAVTAQLTAINDFFDEVREELDELARWLSEFENWLSGLSTFVLSTPWRIFSSFISGLNVVLNPFWKLLNRRICVTVPIPTMKKKCIKIFRKRKCWKVPWVSQEKFCFRVKQVISGLRIFNVVIDMLMKQITKLLPFLDIERMLIALFPDLSNLPGLPNLNLPSLTLPDFNFPQLGFGDCVESLTQISDGAPAIINSIETCFQLPGLETVYPFVKCHEPPSFCPSE
jgi:hypothetical protein